MKRTFFSGVRVTRSLVLCVCFVDRCLSLCSIFFWQDSDYPFGIFKLFLNSDVQQFHQYQENEL